MKSFKLLKNIWSIEELRNKIKVTLLLLLVYRLGSYIPLIGIDTSMLGALESQVDGGILGLLNAFTGGAFAKASILALGIMPYISASIIVQIMGIAIPYLQKLQKDGESGRKKINRITRWLTIAITFVQAPGYIVNLRTQLPSETFMISDSVFWYTSLITLVTGTVFTMWIGEKMTDKGIGNGISLLIMVGIIARLPQAFIQEINSKLNGEGGLIMILIEVLMWILVISLSLLLIEAIRRVRVQYVKSGAGGMNNMNKVKNNYIPLKLNSSGVMPIIFAQAIMFLPLSFSGMMLSGDKVPVFVQIFSDIHGLWYNIIFSFMIIIFTYFYTAISIPTKDISNNLKRDGGFIPGVKPGEATSRYIDNVVSKITLPGSLFLCLIAVLPSISFKFGVGQEFSLFFGGTSLLILVGVALDSLQQINSYLLNHHYDGLINKDKGKMIDINI